MHRVKLPLSPLGDIFCRKLISFRNPQSLAEWLESEAFGEVLESGDRSVLVLINLLNTQGAKFAWFYYLCLMKFITLGKGYVMFEVYFLLLESLVHNSTNEEERDFIMLHVLQPIHNSFGSHYLTKNALSVPLGFEQRKNRTNYTWPVIPVIDSNTDLYNLGIILYFVLKSNINIVGNRGGLTTDSYDVIVDVIERILLPYMKKISSVSHIESLVSTLETHAST
jgi:hypothetical protein